MTATTPATPYHGPTSDRTRADADLALEIEARCDEVLPLVASRLAA